MDSTYALRRLFYALAVALTSVQCALSSTPGGAPQELRTQEEQLNELRRASATRVDVRFTGPHVSFASFDLPAQGDSPQQAALRFLERFAGLYQLPNPRQTLVVERVAAREGGATVFVNQHMDGIVVFGAELAVHVDNGRIRSTNGAYLTHVPLARTPALGPADAVAAARKHAIGTFKDVQAVGAPRLVYFNHSLFRGPAEIEAIKADALTHLAWMLTVLDGSMADGFVYLVDAQTGAILERLRTLQDARERSVWSSPSASIFCGFPGDREWFRESGVVSGAAPDAEGFGAFTAAASVYDFYAGRFGRDSYDGQGAVMWMHLDVGGFLGNNAQARRICSDLLFTNDMATTDVVAHEFTHLVIIHTANFPTNNAQPGSLHESYADVFAALIDGANWTVGETSVQGVIRDLGNPPAVIGPEGAPFPDRMGLFNLSPASAHTNANIMNKAAFLIAAGGTGTFTGITVTGIGRQKLGELYYAVLTGFLTSNASFATAAAMTIVQARSWAATGTFGFTPADACQVNQAFAAVELASSDQDCDLNPDSSDPDRDGDTVPDLRDNCPTTFNPAQTDSDGDRSSGDACDDDDDNDGVPDPEDNCAVVANPLTNGSQADFDRDGIGDACDDFDRDGRSDATDNCRLAANGNQTDSDADGVGDACDVDRDGDGVCQIRRAVTRDDGGVPPGGCRAVDNCPLVSNANQQDTDGDLMGDACDACAGADSGRDEDGDGIDSTCDLDDDGDGVQDTADNCPTTANANQHDLNGNGIGLPCDPGEQVRPLERLAVEFRLNRPVARFQTVEIPLLFDPGNGECLAGEQRGIQIDLEVAGAVHAVLTDYEQSIRFAQGPTGKGAPMVSGPRTASFRPAFDACSLGTSDLAAQTRKAGFNTARSYVLVISALDTLPAETRVTMTTRVADRDGR